MFDRQGTQSGDCCPTKKRFRGEGREHTSLYTLYRREGEGECDVMEVERNTRDGEGESNDQVIIIVVIEGDGMEGGMKVEWTTK